VSDDPIPRRTRDPDAAGLARPSGRGFADAQNDPGLSDDLMSQFEAIGRMLEARRQAQEHPDTEPAQPGDVHEPHHTPTVTGSTADPGPTPTRITTATTPATVHGEADSASPRARRNLIIICIAIAALLAVGGGAAALVSSHHPAAAAVHATASTPPPTPDEIQAAEWVAAEVGPTHVAACDVNVCALLRSAGMPSASVVTVGSDVSDVERADVLVSTAVSRRMFGAALTAITSAEPLAVFGSGADRVEVTAVALAGAGDYAHRLSLDREARQRTGAVLARNPRIKLADHRDSAALTDGRVDSRLCSLLALIGASHTITIASFTASGPGAGADIPESGMVISTVDGRSAAGTSAPARTLSALVAAQNPPYQPMPITTGAEDLSIAFPQPEPLGLISASTS
jgi:hypothetical protein